LGAKSAVSKTRSALLRIKSEGFELPSPFRGSIAESFDSNAAGQATFDGRLDEIRCEKCERDGHIDLTRAAFLAGRDLLILDEDPPIFPLLRMQPGRLGRL
jgi:hypothetical protein